MLAETRFYAPLTGCFAALLEKSLPLHCRRTIYAG